MIIVVLQRHPALKVKMFQKLLFTTVPKLYGREWVPQKKYLNQVTMLSTFMSHIPVKTSFRIRCWHAQQLREYSRLHVNQQLHDVSRVLLRQRVPSHHVFLSWHSALFFSYSASQLNDNTHSHSHGRLDCINTEQLVEFIRKFNSRKPGNLSKTAGSCWKMLRELR